MATLREWACLEHGEFDGTHSICPAYGCDSAHVTQEFRTPVGIGTQYTKRFDAGIRKSADMYGVNNWKSAKEGDVSFAGRADPALGQKLLWGDECKKVMGHSFAELTQVAAKPLIISKRDGSQARLERNNGMRDAANEVGITRRRLPQAHEVTAHKGDKGAKEQAQALTV
jgi:hypothetical protein